MIDLHFHSTHSDGSDTPTALVELAAGVMRHGNAAPLKAISLTDHDTTSGIVEARRRADELGIELISGCEISALFEKQSIHLLVYFCEDPGSPIGTMLDTLRDDRATRNTRLIAKCQDAGFDITIEDVAAKAGTVEGIGRPHFAEVFVERGYANSIQEVFDHYLAAGGPIYVPKAHFTPRDVASAATASGGVCVLAHPFLVERDPVALRPVIETLVDDGIVGIECYYSRHSEEQRSFLLALADDYDLVATGGSDYHGNKKPDLFLGIGQGDLEVPDEVLDALREARPVIS